MTRIMGVLVFIFFCFVSMAGTGFGETRYVTDRLYLSLRQGPGNDQPSLALLPSDTRVEVVERRDDWARVVLDDGRTGWVMGKYLVKDLPKSVLVEQLRGEIHKKTLTIEKLQARIKAMSSKIDELEGKIQEKSRVVARLEEEIRNTPPGNQESGGKGGDASPLMERLRQENASLKRDLSEFVALKAKEAEMEKELEQLKGRLAREGSQVGRAAAGPRSGIPKAAYAMVIGALLIGFAVGFLSRRPDKNRYYLR